MKQLKLITLFCASVCLLTGCGESKQSEQPVIAIIKGQPVYLKELEMLGRMALAQNSINFDSPRGQEQYKEIARNLYETLLNIYIMKYGAELENISPTQEEIDAEYNSFVENLKSQGQYDHFMNGFGVDEATLRESIEDHLAINMLRQQKMIDYEYTPTEQEVKDYYLKHQDQFRYPNHIRASHIFIASPKSEPADQRAAAKRRAEEIHKMIGDNPGRTFVSLARKYSDDSATAPRGGDLGFFHKTETGLNETFRDMAFSMREGEVSPVFESDVGYHIAWITDHEQSFEEAKPYVEQFLIQQKKSDHFLQFLTETAKKLDIVKLFDPDQFKVLEPEEIEQPTK